eukprot:3191680-Rhodomonas_salina.4
MQKRNAWSGRLLFLPSESCTLLDSQYNTGHNSTLQRKGTDDTGYQVGYLLRQRYRSAGPYRQAVQLRILVLVSSTKKLASFPQPSKQENVTKGTRHVRHLDLNLVWSVSPVGGWGRAHEAVSRAWYS